MNEEAKNDGAKSPRKTYVHVVGVILLGAIMASVFVGGPLGVLGYVAGLFNLMEVFFIVLFLLMLSSPVAVVGGLVLVPRTIYLWRSLSSRERRQHVLLIAASVTLIISVGLLFTGKRFNDDDMCMRGFYRYAKIRTDVPAIQAWLDTLDPNDCREQRLDMKFAPGVIPPPDLPKSIPWPPCLTGLRSANTRLLLDGSGRPMIRLSWGNGRTGLWGIMVGNRDIEVPKTQEPAWKEYQSGGTTQQTWEYGEYRRPLASGAYIWRDLE